jgi:hypothetical protein
MVAPVFVMLRAHAEIVPAVVRLILDLFTCL